MIRSIRTTSAVLFAIAASSLGYGCAGADQGEGSTATPSAEPSSSARPSTDALGSVTKLVSEDTEDGLHFEVIAFPDGTLGYMESAPHENHSPVVTQADVDSLSPAEIYAKALPGKPIPSVLTSMTGSAHETTAPPPVPPRPEKSVPQTQPEKTTKAQAEKPAGQINLASTVNLASINSTAPGQTTGLGSCPLWWYQSKFSCVENQNTICAQNTTWAYVYNEKAQSGGANVCVDSGTAQVVVTENSNQVTFSVPTGNYATFTINTSFHCGWIWSLFFVYYTCDIMDQKFIEFSLSPTDAISQFSAAVNPYP